MNILPIVERELRVLSRRPATYYSRLSAAMIMLIVMMPMLLVTGFVPPPRLGASIFLTLMWIAFIFSLLTGVGLTSDCISVEKREGTLGLLFLTDLKGLDVVVGKLAANSVVSLYGLFGVVPLLAVTLMLGGVTLAQIAAVALALLNAMFLSLSAGVLASTYSRDRRRASSLAFLLILVFAAGSPLCGAGLGFYLDYKGFQVEKELMIPFLVASPGFAFVQASARFMAFDTRLFWISMAVTHGLGWGLLLLSARIIPRVWQDKPATAAKLRLLDRIRNLFQGSPPVRKLYRQRLLGMNPIAWLAGRDRLKPLYPWFLLGAGLAGWLTGAIWIGRDWLSIPVTVISILSVHGVFRMWIASEAGRKFSDDLRSGALELVLSTSLKLNEILDGQLLALRRQFLRAAIGVLVIDLVLMFVCVTWGDHLEINDRIAFIAAGIAGMIMFAADMYTLGWTGMWHGISARDPNRSAGNAISQVLFLPWAFCSVLWTSYGIFYAFCEAASLNLPAPIRPSFALALGSWFAIGIGNDLFFLHRCRKRLRQEFRGLAMKRYSGTTEKTFFQVLTSFFWRGNSHD